MLKVNYPALMPCSEKRARMLLERGGACVVLMVPFTIPPVDRRVEDSALQPLRLKLDPGSKATGMALEKETVDANTSEIVRAIPVHMLLEWQHRGEAIWDALARRRAFRRRRRGNLRYRPSRFDNRSKPKGWLAPSLRHRVDTVLGWVTRIGRLRPITALSQKLMRFDTQALEHPEISGTGYQHGSLFGYEVREYLLEKWGRKCAYCDATGLPLEIDHIHPRSKGGSDRLSNLTLASHPCNQRKGNQPLEQFLAKATEPAQKIMAKAKSPLRDAAAVNSSGWALFQRLKARGLEVEVASGGRTKWNRYRLSIPKTHCLDAACVWHVDAVECWKQPVLQVQGRERGRYQRTRLTKYGFPHVYLTRSKSAFGFQTGELIGAVGRTGKKVGTYLGRVAIRASGSIDLQTGNGLVQGKASTDSLPWSGVKMDRVFVDQDSIGQRRLRELGRLTPPRYPSPA